MPREVVDGKTRAETGVKQRGEPQPRGAGKRYRGTKTSGASENVRVDVKNRRRTTPDDPGRVAHAGAALAYTYVEAAAPAVGAAVRLLRECPRHPPSRSIGRPPPVMRSLKHHGPVGPPNYYRATLRMAASSASPSRGAPSIRLRGLKDRDEWGEPRQHPRERGGTHRP